MKMTMKRIALSALMLIGGTVSAECLLKPEQVTGAKYIGTYKIEKLSISGIQFSPKHGDLTRDPTFDLDTLYEIRSKSGSARLRFADRYLINGASYLGNAQWENNTYPDAPGEYQLYALSTKQKADGETITIVGDSITWWSAGKNFRCLLSDQLPGVRFVGPHTDAFGHGHAGEGGNKTPDVIARLKNIKASDYYILHIGTNDWPIGDPDFSFENIKKISSLLSKKGGKVIVLTILPRLDQHDERNRKINDRLRLWAGKGCNCTVIDFEDDFRDIDNPDQLYWDSGLHPNLLGYQKLVDIIAPMIRAHLISVPNSYSRN